VKGGATMAKRKKAGVTTRDVSRAHIGLKNLHAKLESHLAEMTPAEKARLKKELNLKLKIVKVLCKLLKLTGFTPFRSKSRKSTRSKSAKSARRRR
jgi:hypothetical protein